MQEVIIVGAGIGGLACAVRLLKEGYKVKILEKEDTIGGCINIKKEGKYTFDLTSSIIMTPQIYTDLFKDIGLNYEEYFEMDNIEHIYNVKYYNGSEYDFYSNLDKMNNILENIEKGLFFRYAEFLSKSYEKYMISQNDFLGKPMISIKELLNYKSLYALKKLKFLENSNRYIKEILKNDELEKYILFQTMYIGIDPYRNSNIYTLIPAISAVCGFGYIQGGLYKYIEALEKVIYELGGNIETNKNVDKIIIEDNKVQGIEADGQIYKCDIVINNTDYAYCIKNLVDEKYFKKGLYTVNNIDDKEFSCSVFMLYLGLKRKYPHLNVHNIYINDKFKENIQSSFRGDLPKEPSLYMYYPSQIDKTKSDEDVTLNIMVRVPNLKEGNMSWNNDDIKIYRDIIIEQVRNIKGLEDIESNIKSESYLTPRDLQDKYNFKYGCAYGISHKISQTMYFRPHIKKKDVEGLYFAGSSIHPGNGASVIIEGSKLVVNQIIKDYKENNK